MPKEKNKLISEKIAKIGEFCEPKPEAEIPQKEETQKEEKQEQETSKQEIPPLEGKSPEEIKERIVKLISEISSRGLSEEEKTKFINEFTFWNSSLFELLDIGNSLKSVINKIPSLSPGQALAVYAAGTAGLVVLLRKDLSNKIFKTKQPETKSIKNKEEIKQEEKIPSDDEGLEGEGIPKYAPQAQ